MSVRFSLPLLPRASSLRPRISHFTAGPAKFGASCRAYASDPSKDLPVAESKQETGPNMQQQEHVSEEAAKMAKMTGGTGPDLDVGTPVQDILKEDKEAQKNAPQVLKDSIKTNQKPPKPGTRPFSTYARRRQEMGMDSIASHDQPVFPLEVQPSTDIIQAASQELQPTGHKFPLPTLPLASNMHKDYRYDPIVKQITNLMMQDGKLSVAQKNMSILLQHLRTSPPPTFNASRPLMPGAPPPSHLPLNPILYMTLALDSIAPLLRIRSQRGAAGGGMALQIPVPLGLRQRRRQAFVWVLDLASKRKDGRQSLAQRIAAEMISIVEGKSSLWEKRTGVHKVATAARTNINFGRGRRR